METKISAIEALARHLDVEPLEIYSSDGAYHYGAREYLVLDETDANIRAFDAILDNVWAFNTDFIAAHAVDGVSKEVIVVLKVLHEEANKAIRVLIKDVDHFVDDAIRCDGRGHFLSMYDGEETVVDGWNIYRVN